MDISHIDLTDQFTGILKRTISHNAIFYLLADHLKKKIPASLVRMGDGEQIILYRYFNGDGDKLIRNVFDKEWEVRMGYVDATIADAAGYILDAERSCTYFSPNLTGTVYDSFNLYQYFSERDFYVDNFFVNTLRHEQIEELYKLAKKILILHHNQELGQYVIDHYNRVSGSAKNIDNTDHYRFEYMQLKNWDQINEIVERAGLSDNTLILISGSKIIGPRLTNKYNKICIDIGNTMDHWLFC